MHTGNTNFLSKIETKELGRKNQLTIIEKYILTRDVGSEGTWGFLHNLKHKN